MGLFNKAVKEESKLRMAIAGPSGSGKTYTSLAIAAALANGAPIAVVDTEHGSASKYADLWGFDVANMHAPFHPDKFVAALREAEAAGYAVIILDSISHAWSGTGGVLDIVDEAAKRSKSGNTYMAWKEGTPVQNKLIDAIVQSGIHVIATMRSKTEYVLADTGNGKQAPRKVGMAPVQRDQFEYEFDVVLDMDIDNNAIVSKTRCPALTGRVFAKPGADVADILAGWLHGAATQPTAQPSSVTVDGAPAVSQDGPENLFETLTPTDEELEILGTWKDVADAFAWAVEIGACSNEFEARNSLKNLINDEFGGKFTKANAGAVYVAYYRKQLKKAQERQEAA